MEIQKNELWATLDGKESVLTYLNPSGDYKVKLDCTDYVFAPAWVLHQDGDFQLERGQHSLNITKVTPITEVLFQKFPPYIFYHFCELTHFELTHQQLNGFTGDDLVNAKNLNSFNVSHNQIQRIESNTFVHLPELQIVDLSFNRIDFIADDAFQVPALTWLYLQNNRLATVNWDQLRGPAGTLTKQPNDFLTIEGSNTTTLQTAVANNPWAST